MVRQRKVDLLQRQAMLLLVRLAVQDIDGLVAQQDEAIAGLVAMTIELGAEGLVLQLLAAKGAGHEVVHPLDVLLGNAILLEPGGHTSRIVVLLVLEHLLGEHLQLELALLLRRQLQAIDPGQVQAMQAVQILGGLLTVAGRMGPALVQHLAGQLLCQSQEPHALGIGDEVLVEAVGSIVAGNEALDEGPDLVGRLLRCLAACWASRRRQ